MKGPILGPRSARAAIRLARLAPPALAALVLSVQFTLAHFSPAAVNPAASLDRLVAGTADTPFQFRALLPWFVRAAESVLGCLPISLNAAHLFALGEITALLVAQAGIGRLLTRIGFDRAQAWLWSFSLYFVLAYVYLAPEYLRLWYPADVPAIAFFAWGLVWLIERRWGRFAAVFAIGTLNRETTIFLALAALLVEWEGPHRRHALLRFLALSGLWLMIKTALAWLYRDNPGLGLFASGRPANNLAILGDWRVLVRLTSFAGFTWMPALIFYRRIANRDLACALWIVPPYLMAMMLVANLNELRIYGELVPLLLPASLLALKAADPPRARQR